MYRCFPDTTAVYCIPMFVNELVLVYLSTPLDFVFCLARLTVCISCWYFHCCTVVCPVFPLPPTPTTPLPPTPPPPPHTHTHTPWLISVLSNRQTVLQAWICVDNCMCCHTEIDVVDLSIVPSLSILTAGQPVPAQTPWHQRSDIVAMRMPIIESLVWLKWDLNARSLSLEADTSTTKPFEVVVMCVNRGSARTCAHVAYVNECIINDSWDCHQGHICPDWCRLCANRFSCLFIHIRMCAEDHFKADPFIGLKVRHAQVFLPGYTYMCAEDHFKADHFSGPMVRSTHVWEVPGVLLAVPVASYRYQVLRTFYSSDYPARRLASQGQLDSWFPWWLYTITGWDNKTAVQILSQCGSMCPFADLFSWHTLHVACMVRNNDPPPLPPPRPLSLQKRKKLLACMLHCVTSSDVCSIF